MLEALGNLGDFVGGIAVVVTLVYLAVQVRQNTAQLRRSAEIDHIDARDTTFESFSRFRSQVISNPEVAALYYRGMSDFNALDPVERMRFGLLAEELLYILQTSFARHETVTTAGEVDARELGVDVILRSAGIRQWWSRQRDRFDPAFIEFIDEQIERELPAD